MNKIYTAIKDINSLEEYINNGEVLFVIEEGKNFIMEKILWKLFEINSKSRSAYFTFGKLEEGLLITSAVRIKYAEGYSIEDIRESFSDWNDRERIDYVFIENVEKLKCENEFLYCDKLEYNMMKIKELAKEFNIPVIISYGDDTFLRMENFSDSIENKSFDFLAIEKYADITRYIDVGILANEEHFRMFSSNEEDYLYIPKFKKPDIISFINAFAPIHVKGHGIVLLELDIMEELKGILSSESIYEYVKIIKGSEETDFSLKLCMYKILLKRLSLNREEKELIKKEIKLIRNTVDFLKAESCEMELQFIYEDRIFNKKFTNFYSIKKYLDKKMDTDFGEKYLIIPKNNDFRIVLNYKGEIISVCKSSSSMQGDYNEIDKLLY